MSYHSSNNQHTTACVRSVYTTVNTADSRHVCTRTPPQSLL